MKIVSYSFTQLSFLVENIYLNEIVKLFQSFILDNRFRFYQV